MNILDELVAKGVSGETIVKVAKLIADAEQAQERRLKNTERMRTVRAHAHTGVHTETQKPAYIEEEKKVEIKKARKKKGYMPEDWKPIIATEDTVEFQRFTDYCKANGKQYMDWDAGWRNWRTSPYRKTAASTVGNPQVSAAKQKEIDTYFAQLEEAKRRNPRGQARQTNGGTEVRGDTDMGAGWPDNVQKLRPSG